MDPAGSGGGHPTDAQRAEEARPVLDSLIDAVGGADPAALAGLLRDDVAWLGPGGTVHDVEPAVERLRAVAARADGWRPPQQQGAKAVLRWSGSGEGALVVEVRRGRIIFVAEA